MSSSSNAPLGVDLSPLQAGGWIVPVLRGAAPCLVISAGRVTGAGFALLHEISADINVFAIIASEAAEGEPRIEAQIFCPPGAVSEAPILPEAGVNPVFDAMPIDWRSSDYEGVPPLAMSSSEIEHVVHWPLVCAEALRLRPDFDGGVASVPHYPRSSPPIHRWAIPMRVDGFPLALLVADGLDRDGVEMILRRDLGRWLRALAPWTLAIAIGSEGFERLIVTADYPGIDGPVRIDRECFVDVARADSGWCAEDPSLRLGSLSPLTRTAMAMEV